MLKNKRSLCILAICFFIGMFCVGFKINNKDINIISVHSDREIMIDNLQDLELNSDLVIRAKVLDGSFNEIYRTPSNLINYGITYTDLEITSVIFGDADIGDIIKITEEYFYVDKLTVRNVFCMQNYAPSTVNQEYIFFLKKYTSDKPKFEDMYFPIGVEKGRYPILNSQNNLFKSTRSFVDINEFTNQELNLGNGDSTEYRIIFNEVVRKYY